MGRMKPSGGEVIGLVRLPVAAGNQRAAFCFVRLDAQRINF
jgi:hypothetical protein